MLGSTCFLLPLLNSAIVVQTQQQMIYKINEPGYIPIKFSLETLKFECYIILHYIKYYS